MLAVAAAGIGLLVHTPRTAGPPFRLDGHGKLGLSGLGAGLEAAGFGVSSSDTPTIPDHGLTVSVEPTAVSHDEAHAWLGSIRAGAVLLLATDRPNPLTQALGVRFGVFPDDAGPTAGGLRAFPALSRGASAPTPRSWPCPARSAVMIGSRSSAVMVVVPVGRGSVWVLSQPQMLTNAGHRRRRPRGRAATGRACRRRHGVGGRVPPGRLADTRLACLSSALGAARHPRGGCDRDPGCGHGRPQARVR